MFIGLSLHTDVCLLIHYFSAFTLLVYENYIANYIVSSRPIATQTPFSYGTVDRQQVQPC